MSQIRIDPATVAETEAELAALNEFNNNIQKL